MYLLFEIIFYVNVNVEICTITNYFYNIIVNSTTMCEFLSLIIYH